jgi:hypothetical protein
MTQSISHRGSLPGGVSILTVFFTIAYIGIMALANDIMTLVSFFLHPHSVLLNMHRETSFTLLC